MVKRPSGSQESRIPRCPEAGVNTVQTQAMTSTPIKRLLLVVEDNPGDARLLREMVSEHDSMNTEVTHVESMKEAEAHLSERAADVILLDLGLPDAQGLDGVRRVHAAAPRVPLVVLTS